MVSYPVFLQFPLVYLLCLFIEKRNGIDSIQISDENELIEGKQNRFKIADADIIVFDEEEKPLLVIGPEITTSPKTFGRSISIYIIARNVKFINMCSVVEIELKKSGG